MKEKPEKIPVVSYWIRRQCDAGNTPEIDQAKLTKILSETSIPSVLEQADRLLVYLGDELLKTGRPGGRVSLSQRHRLVTATIGAAPDPGGTLMLLIQELAQGGLLNPTDVTQYDDQLSLTFKGWARHGELKRHTIDSRIAFMAMPFNIPLLDLVFREHFRPAVKQTGFDLQRLDDHPKAGNIDDRLRVEIRGSRFLIAELTGANAGAYWEAGFAEGLGKPVIYTCEKKHFEDSKSKPHFDTNHHLTVLWDENALPLAVEQLKATIRETLPSEAKQQD
ncbi:MAG TPA: hypothetical protein VJ728_10930 [Candidatus Binataceae bacterium]|nr:hypothetical protein [Candidatus Binataceae bacterium]